jgi:cellulase (glycosyl hydrolase family 5)
MSTPALDVRRSRRTLFGALLALAAVTLVALAIAPASHAKSFDVGFADPLYNDPAKSDHELGLTETTNADIIRVNMYWSQVAFNKPANPRDPGDPAYNWSGYDTAISNAAAHGFDVDLTVLAAPSWAEGPNRPSDTDKYPLGSWKPDANAFGDFAHAVAERYSGSYSGLPAVKYFEAWNEPNLSTYITPQWDGKKNMASDIYAKLLNAFYDEVKAVDPDAKIVSGGTAPYGDPPGGPNRTQPLRFEQEMLCLTPHNKKTSCPNGEPSKFDIYAHHPINRTDPPEAKADNKGDIEVADFGQLTKAMRKAEKFHTLGTGGKHELWANEVWWQTNPPDKAEGLPLKTQARYYEQALYMLWDEGASNVTLLQFRDAKYTPGEFTLASYQTGVYTDKGKRKPSADAIAFPFVTDRKGKGAKLLAWGRAPKSGKLTISASTGKGGYKKVGSVNVKAGKVFTANVHVQGRAKLRASVGGETSLVWSQKH